MKIKASVTKWSYIVGAGVMITDETGIVVAQLAIHNVRADAESRQAISMNIAQAVADAINKNA